MDWKELKRDDAAELYDGYCRGERFDVDSHYLELQQELRDIFQESLDALHISADDIARKNYSYQIDLNFGIKMYSLLNDKYEMDVRTAANGDVWRYLCTCVVPDLVEKRYGIDHPDRFWKKTRRLWLRTLWWYIYLSWQGTELATIKTLKDNTTDEILQLVDRCGSGGYRVSLYRELMKKNGELNLKE